MGARGKIFKEFLYKLAISFWFYLSVNGSWEEPALRALFCTVAFVVRLRICAVVIPRSTHFMWDPCETMVPLLVSSFHLWPAVAYITGRQSRLRFLHIKISFIFSYKIFFFCQLTISTRSTIKWLHLYFGYFLLTKIYLTKPLNMPQS